MSCIVYRTDPSSVSPAYLSTHKCCAISESTLPISTPSVGFLSSSPRVPPAIRGSILLLSAVGHLLVWWVKGSQNLLSQQCPLSRLCGVVCEKCRIFDLLGILQSFTFEDFVVIPMSLLLPISVFFVEKDAFTAQNLNSCLS